MKFTAGAAAILTIAGIANSAARPSHGVAVQQEIAVEHNLLYYTVIRNHPDPPMSLVDQMARRHVPGVSIAVIHNGKIEWAKAYGVTKLGGPPVTPETIFGAASMSKPLTAMAVLQLAQEGRIDLDRNVNDYLKSWKLPENQYTVRKKVTVRELLSHTSGIGTHNGAIYNPAKGIPTVLQILNGEKPATTPPVRVEAEPGSKYAYANGGYLILELLITEISGKPFAQYMQDAILRPLGMTHSTFAAPLPPEKAAQAATGYWENGKDGISPANFVEPNAAAGGLWTTASDYARFVIELTDEYSGKSHLILNQTTARMMVTAGMGPSKNMRWGLGVRVGGSAPDIYFEHGGSALYQCDMVGYVKGEGVVVLTSGGGGGLLTDEIVRSVAHVYGWPDFQPVERTMAAVDPAIYNGLVGTYDFIKVTREGDKLMAEIPLGSQRQELVPESPTHYFLRGGLTDIVFDLGPSGRATGLEFVTSMVHWHKDRTQ